MLNRIRIGNRRLVTPNHFPLESLRGGPCQRQPGADGPTANRLLMGYRRMSENLTAEASIDLSAASNPQGGDHVFRGQATGNFL